MRYSILAPAFLAASLLCSPLAFAATDAPAPATSTAKPSAHHGQMHGHMHGHMRHHKMRMHRSHHWNRSRMPLGKLDLTDAQRTDIHKLMHNRSDQGKLEHKALREKRMALQNATPGTNAYQSAANELAKAKASAASKRVLRHAKQQADIYQVLTPAQRTKLADLRTQHQERMQKWRDAHKDQPKKITPAAPATTG